MARMKKFLLLILLSPLSFGQDKNTSTEFNLSCKVTGQAYLETKDGKSKISPLQIPIIQIEFIALIAPGRACKINQ